MAFDRIADVHSCLLGLIWQRNRQDRSFPARLAQLAMALLDLPMALVLPLKSTSGRIVCGLKITR